MGWEWVTVALVLVAWAAYGSSHVLHMAHMRDASTMIQKNKMS